VPVGSGFSDQVGAMNMVYGILTALYWRERSSKGREVKVDLMSAMLAHQGQEMLTAMTPRSTYIQHRTAGLRSR
jgi:crotonobetainyl-CoA:carnitine CoA-transferase CaiB-like acyl-CoA transferase